MSDVHGNAKKRIDYILFLERSVLADVALSCMCTLLAEATHFNFCTNLISCVIARLSRKSWDKVRPPFLQ